MAKKSVATQVAATPVPNGRRVQNRRSPAQAAVANMAAAVVAPAQQPVAAPKPAVVALRGGQAVSAIALTGNPYRTGAPHNVAWWATITAACKDGKSVPVAGLLL